MKDEVASEANATPTGAASGRKRRTEKSNDALRALERFYLDNFGSLADAVDAAVRILKSTLDETREELAIHDVSGRVKTLDSALKKYNDKYRSEHEAAGADVPIRELLTDLIGVRIVCLYEDDIPKIAERVKQAFEVVGETDKIGAMNAHADRFGYKAIHYDLQLGTPRGGLGEYRKLAGFPVELQIRTVFQDAWSVIDHQLKYKKSVHPSLARRINVFAALCELADQEFVRIRDDIRATPSDVRAVAGASAADTKTLNLREFLEVVRRIFPADVVLPDQADILLSIILRLSPSLTGRELSEEFEVWGERLQEGYDAFQAKHRKKLSPLTRTRLLLRVARPDSFRTLLTSPEMLDLVEEIRSLPIVEADT